MTANIKLAPWILILLVIPTVTYLGTMIAIPEQFRLSILDYILITANTIVIIYYVLGMIRKRDALQIDDTTIKVRTPFRYKEYRIKDITVISIEDRDTVLRGIHQGVTCDLVSNIYTVPLSKVKDHLLQTFPHIKQQ